MKSSGRDSQSSGSWFILYLTLETISHEIILQHDDFLDISFRTLSEKLIKKYNNGEK